MLKRRKRSLFSYAFIFALSVVMVTNISAAGTLSTASESTNEKNVTVSTSETYQTIASIFNSKRTRVDLKADDGGRKDMIWEYWNNWIVKTGKSDTATFNGLTFKLTSGGTSDRGIVWKWDNKLVQTSLDTPWATIDGIMANNPDGSGAVELEISGLSAGTHTITTWHSFCEKNDGGSTMSVYINGELKASGVEVPTLVADDDDAARLYMTFTAKEGETVKILFKADGNGSYDNAILNAFEIDGPDPFKSISNPQPEIGDEHWEKDKDLTWEPGKDAVSHDVYIGTDYDSVFNANRSSAEYKGNFTQASFKLDDTYSHMNTYWWRVDEIDSAGNVTKGGVIPFRIAHLAFPGAEGYGRYARGGRGGRVIEVTNLNDSGPGSLRQAIEVEKGPRVIVFRVGGVIKLKSRLTIPKDGGDVYVAGQTAPGDGITLIQQPFGMYYCNDAIIRHVRLRVGDVAGISLDGMGMAGANHSIIDHCSISWSIDEGTSSRSAHNITFQRNIIAEALNNSVHFQYASDQSGTERHSFAASISGNIGSFHHNLLVHCAGRNWSLAGGMEQDGIRYAGYLDIRNNVVYNYGYRTTDGGVKRVNFVNNYYKAGPSSTQKNFFSIDGDELGTGDIQKAYLSGNVMVDMNGNYVLTAEEDDWKRATCKYLPVEMVRSDEPFYPSYVTTQTAEEAYLSVLSDVGATKPKQDYLDQRYIRETREGTYTYVGSVDGMKGIIDSQEDVGGYPDLKGGPAPADSDHDGMPDTWEKFYGLNPSDPEDRNGLELSADGYTNLEMYLSVLAGDDVKWSSVALAKNKGNDMAGIEEADETTTGIVSGSIKIKIDDKYFTPKEDDGSQLKPVIINDRTYLPVRALAEVLNMNVEWDETTSTVSLSTKKEGSKQEDSLSTSPPASQNSSDSVTAYVNYKLSIKVNGEDFYAHDSDGSILYPVIINSRTYLPVRALADALELKVDWDAASKTVLLITKYGTEEKVITIAYDTGATSPGAAPTSVELRNDPKAGVRYNTIQNAQKKLNIKINWKYVTSDNLIVDYISSIASGKKYSDIILTSTTRVLPKLALNNYIVPIDKYIDFDNDPLYNMDYMATATEYLGRRWGFATEPYNVGYVTFYNKDIFAKEGLKDLQEVYEEGNWTWDTLMEYGAKATHDYNGDGTPEQYGIILGNMQNGMQALVYSNGGRFVEYDPQTNSYNFAADEGSKAAKAIDLIYEMMHRRISTPSSSIKFDKYPAAMLIGKEISDGYIYTNAGLYVGAVPLPKGPDAEKTTFVCANGSHAYFIPLNTDADVAAEVIKEAFTYWDTSKSEYLTKDDILRNKFKPHLMDEADVEWAVKNFESPIATQVKYFSNFRGYYMNNIVIKVAWNDWYTTYNNISELYNRHRKNLQNSILNDLKP